MDMQSGRLIAALAGTPLPAGFNQVPDELERAAMRKLLSATAAGKAEAQVNMLSQHPLAKWGRDMRKDKRKAKTAAASRRKNRK